MISADIKTDVKQEIKELLTVSYNLTEVPSQNLKYNVKQTCIQSLSQKVNSLSIDVKLSCNIRLQFVLVHRTAQLTG